MIQTRCPSCDKSLKLADNLQGKQIRCPACKNVFRVAAPAEEVAAAPPPPRQAVKPRASAAAPRVFVSHSTEDRAFVEDEIVRFLAVSGITTWYAPDDIRTAERWERTILEGLRACDWFLIVMSPRSAGSVWVKREVDWVFAKGRHRIVPVLLEDCDSDDFHIGLAAIQHVDFRGDWEEARKRLLAVWGGGYK